MTFPSIIIGLALIALPTTTAVSGVEQSTTPQESTTPQKVLSKASDWVADSDDHICGLQAVRTLSNPAEVDYSLLWDATPEIKQMTDEGIDPESADGIRLKKLAADRIDDAAKEVMGEKSHCSVWKEISHKDDRDIPDITKAVKKKFPK